MASDGFMAVFSNSIRDVAKFSLAFGGGGTTAAERAEFLELSPPAILEAVVAFNAMAQDRLGVELFEVAGDQITALL